MKLKFFCLVAAAMALFSLSAIGAVSEDVDVSVLVLPMPPMISAASLTDAEGNVVSHLDVNREYVVNATLFERNGISDVSSIHARIYYAGDGTLAQGDIERRSSYEVVWENTGQAGTWSSLPAGYLGEYTHFKKLTPCIFEVSLPFRLDKIAIPSGGQNTWKASVSVIDGSGMVAEFDDMLFDVNDYVEWSGIPSQISLSPVGVEPNGPWALDTPVVVKAVVTSNTEVDVSFCASDLRLGEIAMNASSFFNIYASGAPRSGNIALGYDMAKAVPKNTTRIYQGIYSTPCSLNPSVHGYIDGCSDIVSFTIGVQDGISAPNVPGGNYHSTWVFNIERGGGSTL